MSIAERPVAVHGRLLGVQDLTDDDRAAMIELMRSHYVNVHAEVFYEDLAEKDWVIQLVETDTGQVRGFSTQMHLEADVDGRQIHALFSGDTIVDRKYWGHSALAHVWGQLALALIDANPDAELYWFLLSQGHRTYRFLPLFFHEFYPRAESTTPASTRRVIETIARQRYGARFDAEAGIVRADTRQYRLQHHLATIAPGRLNDPSIRYFIARNPGYVDGDELCCLAALTRANFTRAAYRVIGSDRPCFEVPRWVSHVG